MSERTCPICKRLVVVENGRFTQHTDKRFWSEPGPLKQCPMVGRLIRNPRP